MHFFPLSFSFSLSVCLGAFRVCSLCRRHRRRRQCCHYFISFSFLIERFWKVYNDPAACSECCSVCNEKPCNRPIYTVCSLWGNTNDENARTYQTPRANGMAYGTNQTERTQYTHIYMWRKKTRLFLTRMASISAYWCSHGFAVPLYCIKV